MKQQLTQLFPQIKTKAKSYLLSLALFLSGVSNSSVYASDPFDKTKSLANQGITKAQGISIIIFSLAVVLTGLIYGVAGREVKAGIKKHWVGIAASIIAVSAGPSIVEWFSGFLKQ